MFYTVSGIDVGTSHVRAVIGEFEENGALEIRGFGSCKNRGLSKGSVVDLETTVHAMVEAMEEAESQAGARADHTYVSIGCAHIYSRIEKGLVTISGADKEVRQSDMVRVIDQAQNVRVPSDQRIIHVLPISYCVDGQKGIMNPIMMCGVRLEVVCHILFGLASPIDHLVRCIGAAGFPAQDLVYTGLASGEACLSSDEKRSGTIVIDIGCGTTHISHFAQGQLVWAKVLPVGSQHVTRDLAAGLRVPEQVAEDLKLRYGAATTQGINQTEVIEIPGVDGRRVMTTTRLEVARYIEPRMVQIFSHVNAELRDADILPSPTLGVVLVGGGSALPRTAELAEHMLSLAVRLGKPKFPVGSLDERIDNPTYIAALGLSLLARNDILSSSASRLSGRRSGGGAVRRSGDANFVSRVRDFFRLMID